MLNFNEFVVECGNGLNMPVVAISKEQIDCSNEETRNEINDNLVAALDGSFLNPYIGWLRVSKVLALYSINLPRVLFKDMFEGEEVVAVSQFGNIVGEYSDGHIDMKPQEKEYYVYFSYGIGENGHYECYGEFTDEDGLDSIVSDDTQHLNPRGEEQPPQE